MLTNKTCLRLHGSDAGAGGTGRRWMRLARNSSQQAGYSLCVGIDMRYGGLKRVERAEDGFCSLFDVVWIKLAIGLVDVAFV